MTSTPSVRATPADGRSKPAAMRSSELLPDPLGPSTTQRSPRATESVIPCSATAPVALSAWMRKTSRSSSASVPVIRPTAPRSLRAPPRRAGRRRAAPPRPAARRAPRAPAAAPAMVSHGVMRCSGGSGTASVASTASRRPVATARPMPSATPASTPSSGEAEGPPAHAGAQRARAGALRLEIEQAVALVAQESEVASATPSRASASAASAAATSDETMPRAIGSLCRVAVDRRSRRHVERGERRLAQRLGDVAPRPRRGAESHSSSGDRRRQVVGAQSARRARPRRRSRSCRPESCVVGKRGATATRRACTT